MTRTEDVLRLICGITTSGEVAEKYGVTEAEVEQWRADYTRAVERLATRRRGVNVMLVAALAAVVIGAWSSTAWAQTCPSTLPYGLTTFCPNAPAIASQINGNFGRVVQLLEQKVGTANTANVNVTGTLSAASNVSLTNGPLSFTGTSGVITWPGSNTGAKLQMAGGVHELGVQNSTTYLRTSGAVNFYKGGAFATSGAGAGGTQLFSVDTNGKAASLGDMEAGGALRSRTKAVIKDVSACCTTNAGGGCCGGWEQVGADLNTAAGGQYCYLCVERAN